MEYYIDVYVDHQRHWMKKYKFKEAKGKYGIHYSVKVEDSLKRKIIRKLNWRNMKYRCTEACWNRSSDYRRNFFKVNEGPIYKCRYCNKTLEKDMVVVDHVIPVSQAKKNKNARTLLKIRGIENVNDTKNLVASCRKCNNAKDDKMGIWLIKAWLGKYKAYWIIRPIVIWAIIIYMLYQIYDSDVFPIIINNIQEILSFW